ncbi:UDP-N-acetylglucosamine [Xylanimonas cellulosilytica DSM 15894]|uniref:D-inositol 3-phosphate glycosyltransferase n=1 Tax=Xylanimonas cellulosilytica (strain DSM 15894 / JCM 12276 / CECT 5975 / KCTC 9989 / LMG 20990 / NBRC 107835 / XIL07) TaxID=446471 RepID=MSHA_XYLCX|nr:D-inositol-3-phosphate glycosyltransferase [Xylanimonas cellulosilytica]D1BZ82.1 RecName: Full=D-inositol 3-phosphate glycosyltransferase; AltName: Full=N-acetylglucosamine-inositol-phosphate N-acetylglucosaminyltransferase; Short=GlcNAc-Ins-P N-acetylglucosaminyltransferase [Xylanimonas cellulosilytica DSM 15894]ACZ31979.1 UDP-N-acetylglucosamine [Xylanimonas cellulosilytica DSM 15894]
MPGTRGPRVAMLSVHTSPLDQPGTGDAGGMNVYVLELSRALARRGAEVEIFTRATSSAQPPVVDVQPGIRVLHVPAGPFEGLDKNDLPGQLCAFTAGVLRAEAHRSEGWYDVVHTHYWLSGQAGWLAAERWDVPLVHTMHTMARVKNAALAPGDVPEPQGRVIGEEQVVAASDALVASTREEAEDLVRLYGADLDRIHVVPPGVDLDTFTPPVPSDATARTALRERLGLPVDSPLILFAGRVQLLKGPDVLVQALEHLPEEVRLVVLGGASGRPTAVRELEALAHQCGVRDRVLVHPPVERRRLADWYRAADVVAVPSHNESFGLVAAEAQACGTPVVAAAVGGLRTVVLDDVNGVLVDGHDPLAWADVLGALLADDGRRARLAAGARAASRRFGWDEAAAAMLDVYAQATKRRPAR